MSFYNSFPEYVSVAEKRRKADNAREKLKKTNTGLSPVIISGSKIAASWWGKAWNKNLESYSDFYNRIGRGRSYVRHGAVLDLQIEAGIIHALVQGSASAPYHITIKIKPLGARVWKLITESCEGKLDSLQSLLDGKFPKELMELFTVQGKGLFPSPKEISFECSCPDYASMCKHVAAVLYGVGASLDTNPALFFVLRNVHLEDLISKAVAQKTKKLLEKAKTKSCRVIAGNDVSELFGIDMADVAPPAAKKPAVKKPAVKKPVVKKPAAKKPAAKKIT